MAFSKEKMIKTFRAFSDENRLKIIFYLMQGEKCACRLLEDLDISQSTLSHHMKILIDSNIVKARKSGKWTHYSLSEKGIKEAIKKLEYLKDNSFYDNDGCC